jgi:threonine dehydrogenase-like Zn-dependent dehydrogenase
MRAVAVQPDGTLAVVDKPEPTPGPGEVVVSVERCGICGSDLHLRNSGFIPPGAVMGHEFAGTVVAAGRSAGGATDGGATDDNDRDLAIGTRVAVLPSGRDGTCEDCRAGKSHLCPAQAMTAIGLGLNDGGYAELVKAPARSCVPLPDGMSFELGALVEPYAVALHAVRRSRAAAPAADAAAAPNVGIIGAGPVGLLTIAALRHHGVERITVAERSETRAAAAAALGANVQVTDDASRLLRTAGEPFDVIFDAAGVTATLPIALESAKPGGQLVLVGVVDIGEVYAMPGMLWVIKEVDVIPSIAYTDDEYREAVDHVAAGAVPVDTVVSDIRPLEAAEASFKDLARPGGPVKVLLSPRSS